MQNRKKFSISSALATVLVFCAISSSVPLGLAKSKFSVADPEYSSYGSSGAGANAGFEDGGFNGGSFNKNSELTYTEFKKVVAIIAVILIFIFVIEGNKRKEEADQQRLREARID